MKSDFRGDAPLVDGKPLYERYPETHAALAHYYGTGRSPEWLRKTQEALVRESPTQQRTVVVLGKPTQSPSTSISSTPRRAAPLCLVPLETATGGFERSVKAMTAAELLLKHLSEAWEAARYLWRCALCCRRTSSAKQRPIRSRQESSISGPS
jgi:hypothetical protein